MKYKLSRRQIALVIVVAVASGALTGTKPSADPWGFIGYLFGLLLFVWVVIMTIRVLRVGVNKAWVKVS